MITIYISSFITTDEASLVGYTVPGPLAMDHGRFIVHTSLDVSESIITDPSG